MSSHHAEQFHPAQLRRMQRFDVPMSVDMHCHCLPGVDDGPATDEAAIELCMGLVADGVTHAIATPHQLGRYEGRNTPIQTRRAVERLMGLLKERRVPLEIIAGAEVRLDERMPQMIQADEVLLLPDGGDHLLLELPRGTFIDPFPLIRALYFRGVTVIVAHPERHMSLTKQQDVVQRWLEEGALIQINAGSLRGQFGSDAEATAWRWIETGAAALVAGDAHGIDRRSPCLTAAIERIEQRCGLAVARRLCLENPMRLYRRQPLLAAPANPPAVTPSSHGQPGPGPIVTP